MMKVSQALSSILLLCSLVLVCITTSAQDKIPELSMEEIYKKLESILPKDDDFKFDIPSGWSQNLLRQAQIIEINSGESIDSAMKIIDGKPATTWQSKNYNPRPEITIDLGKRVKFNRIVIFNRHTENRGTGGGNNATKELTILISKDDSKNSFEPLGTFKLSGPNAVCYKIQGGGHVCLFVDDTKPNIIETNQTEARLIKLVFNSAHWGEIAPDEWKSSVALSEFMLYFVK